MQDDKAKLTPGTFPPLFTFDGREYEVPPLRVAEGRAKQADGIANRLEGKGASALASRHREEAAWWRKLSSCIEWTPPELLSKYETPEAAGGEKFDAQAALDNTRPADERFHDRMIDEGLRFEPPDSPHSAWVAELLCESERAALCAVDTLLALAEGNEKASLHCLSRIASHLLDGLHALAANEKGRAVRIWGNVLSNSVENFKRLAFHRPELIEDWAHGRASIPGLISKYPGVTKSNTELVKRLRVGEYYHLAIVPKGKRHWQMKGANELAERLQSYIQSCLDHVPQEQARGLELPPWLNDAMKLEPFSGKTWKAWADNAWRLLGEISPDGKPGQHPAFYEPATKICNVRKTRTNPYFENQEDAPSIADNDIKETLFSAFELIATGISPRTRQRKKARKAA